MSEADSTATPTEDQLFLQPSVHAHGRFTNPWDTWEARGVALLLKWQMTETDKSGIPSDKELDETLPVEKTDKDKLENPSEDQIQATWIGHATVLVQMEGLNVLTDPVFADRCSPFSFMGPKRFRPPPFPLAELPRIDVVVISHNHYDHLSLPDVLKIGNKPLWVVPLGIKSWMNHNGITNVVELDWWHEHKLEVGGKQFTLTSVPAQHWSKRTMLDTNLSLWCGWVVASPKLKFYFAGDTGYCTVFEQIGKKCGPFDLAAIPVSSFFFLPSFFEDLGGFLNVCLFACLPFFSFLCWQIGAYEPGWFLKPQHVNPEEAVLVHRDVKAKKSLGIHWGTFTLAFEHYLEPPQRLKAALQANGIPEEDFFVTRHGETVVI